MKDNKYEAMISETLESFAGSKRARPGPFLIGRIMATLERDGSETVWTRITAFISRPAVAFATVAFVLVLNAGILWLKETTPASAVATQNAAKDEFAVTTFSLYEFENQE